MVKNPKKALPGGQRRGAKAESAPTPVMIEQTLSKILCQFQHNRNLNVNINVIVVGDFRNVRKVFKMKNTLIKGALNEIKGNSNVIIGKGKSYGSEKR